MLCILLFDGSSVLPVRYNFSEARVAVWLSGSALVSINQVTLCRVQLVLGWVTGPGFNSRCWKSISYITATQVNSVWLFLRG